MSSCWKQRLSLEASRVGAGLRFQCSLSASFATLTCERRGGGDARVRRRQEYGRVKGDGSLEMAENPQPRGLKKKRAPTIDRWGAHLLVHDVVEEDVIVVWILVLLGQLGFRVHEVRGGAGVRALAVGTFAHARSLHAAHVAMARSRARFQNLSPGARSLRPVNDALNAPGSSLGFADASTSVSRARLWVRAAPTRARVTRRVLQQAPWTERVLQQKFRYQPNRLSVGDSKDKICDRPLQTRRWSALRAATFFHALHRKSCGTGGALGSFSCSQ